MTTKGTQALAYDAENRLLSVTSGGATQASFVYDGDGGRVQKVTPSGTTTYIGKLYEQKPDGSFVKYLWVGSTRLASKSSTGTLLFYHPNHLGSTDLVTDAQSTQVAHYEYLPYGELHSTEGITVPHQYTGKERDPETGFYFYEARYYDPQLGRFLTPDTIVPNWSNPQDFNRYTYAANNPLKYTDPTGHRPFWKRVGSFLRRVVAPVVATVTAIAVTVLLTPFVGPFFAAVIGAQAGATVYNGIATTGANLERGKSPWTSYGRGALATGATAIGGPIGGGAASAALTGGDPGRGATLGAVQLGFSVVGAAIPGGGLIQNAAMAAGQGAAGAAITGGDPGQAAWRSAATAAAVAIASASFQAAIDAGRKVAPAGSSDAKVSMESYAPRPMQGDQNPRTSMALAYRLGGPGAAIDAGVHALTVNEAGVRVPLVTTTYGEGGAAGRALFFGVNDALDQGIPPGPIPTPWGDLSPLNDLRSLFVGGLRRLGADRQDE